MDRPKRRCVARKTAVPSAVHYVGYVEDDETPEMIMRKFEELERMMAASKKEEVDAAAAAPQKEAGPSSSCQPGAKQLSMEAEPQSSLQHQEQPGQDAQAVHAGSGDQVLDDATLLQVFKMTSIFNVKSAMSNNQVLMAGPGAVSAASGLAHPFCGLRSAEQDLDAADQGGLGEVIGPWSLYDAADISEDMEDEDDADWCDQVRELWSDEDEMEVCPQHASASASNLSKRRGDGGGNAVAWPRRPAGAPRERRPPQAGRHKGAIPTGRGRTDVLLQRMARIPWIFQDREAVNKPTPPPSTWAAPWIYVLGPPKPVMPRPAASTLPEQTQLAHLAQAQQQLPPAPSPPAFLQPLAPPPPPLRQPSAPRPPASLPLTSIPASVHTCLQPPQLTCPPTSHTHTHACPAPPQPPMPPMPHMPPMPPMPPAPQLCPVASQGLNPPCQPLPPPPKPAAHPNAKRPPVPPPVLMPAKRAAHAPHAPHAPPPLMQPRVRAASRSPSPPLPPAPPHSSAARCHGAFAGQQGLVVGSGTGSGCNGGSYHHHQPCPQPRPSTQDPPCTHQGSGCASSGWGSEGGRQSGHAGRCMPLGGDQAQPGWSTSQHSVLPQSRDSLNNPSQSQAGVLDQSNTGAVAQAPPPPVLGRIVPTPSSNAVPQGEGGPPPGVVVEAEDITRLHFQALLKQRRGVPFQLVVVNPGWEEPPPGTTPTPAATAPTASAPPTPAPSHTQQQQPALAPPPPRLLSRSAPTSAVGGSETDAGSSEAVDGGDSESSDDDEGEEDVVARLRAVPMTRLCPRGFVAVWARKAVMARVCKQLGTWGYAYVESLSWVWVQPPPSHRLLALPAPCLRASHLTLLIFRRAGDAGRDMHLAHQRSADVVVDALKPAQGCPFQPPLEAMSALEVMLPSAHQGGACLELWAPSTTAGQAQGGVGRPGWTQVVETGGS